MRKPKLFVRASVEKESEETEFEEEPARTFYTGRLMSWYSVKEVEVHPSCFYYSSVTSSISSNLGGSVDPVFPFPSLTESQMMNYMTGCSLFFHHGHGGVGYIQIGQSIVSELNVYELNVNLSSMHCAVMLTCYSGKSDANTNTISFIQAMVNQGATCAIGFTTITYVLDCNLFAERFASTATLSGYTVNQAVQMMSTSGMTLNMVSLCSIAGNGNTMLN